MVYVRGRDSGARAGRDVTLETGTMTSGGSWRYPCAIIREGAEFMIYHVAESLIETINKDDFEVLEKVPEVDEDINLLKREKDKLQERIKEIDKRIEEMSSTEMINASQIQ